jgi:hypothetical protein
MTQRILQIREGTMRKSYPSDIGRDIFAEKVLPILQKARKKTKPPTVDLYEVFCGVLYVLKSGCQWRMLPSDFPKWRTCYDYWQKWSEKFDNAPSLLEEALKKCGRRHSTRPWAGCADNFSYR